MTVKHKISLCMIVKNEIGQIESCLRSIRPFVDEIVVVDTGSTDGTYEIVKQWANVHEVFTDCNDTDGKIMDFSMARQRSFDLASHDWVMWMDGDDEIKDAHLIPDLLGKHFTGNPLFIMFPYEYAHNENGEVTCLHWRERILYPRTGFKWQSPVHEVVTCVLPNSTSVQLDQPIMVHRKSQSGKTTESGRNLRILKKWHEENGDSDIRLLYYLALEYGNEGEQEKALEFHQKYMDLSVWDDEKFMSCMKMADHYQAMGKYKEAIATALQGTTIREGWSESYFHISRSYYFLAQSKSGDVRKNWEKCVHFAELGFKFPPTKTVLFVNPMERTYEMHRYLNIAYNEVGRVEEALNSVEKGLLAKPDDEHLLLNRTIYKSYLSKKKIAEMLDSLVDLKSISNATKNDILTLVEEISSTPTIDDDGSPSVSIVTPERSIEVVSTMNPRDMVFYVGHSVEKWNPQSINSKGIGGSETALWEMTRRLSKMGHRVSVYGDCEGMEGSFEGVDFIDYRKFKNVETEVFISSRRPEAFDEQCLKHSDIGMCWVHDVHCGGSLDHNRSLRIDKFLTLSQWHRDYFLSQYKFLHPDQVLVTRNGIDIRRFLGKSIPRNPKKVVYSSSPDRGLQSALEAWPLVRKQVPDAEFHIYYGFDNWKTTSLLHNDKNQLQIIEYLQKQIEEMSGQGVVAHGRIGQEQLSNEFLGAGVWGYPTWFHETSCQLFNSLIFTDKGMVPIQNVKVGDKVLTHKGRFRPVTQTIKKPYKGRLYAIHGQDRIPPMQVTEEHPVYTMSFHGRTPTYRWELPSVLTTTSDNLFTPRMPFGNQTHLKLSEYTNAFFIDGFATNKYGTKKEPEIVELTEELMYLLGLFCEESVTDSKLHRIDCTIHDSNNLSSRIIKVFGGKIIREKVGGKSNVVPTLNGSKQRNIVDIKTTVRVHNSVWVNVLRTMTSHGKHRTLPDFVWNCSEKFQKAFLDGYTLGVTFSKTARVMGRGRGFVSKHPSLVFGIAQLRHNLGMHSSIKFRKLQKNYAVSWAKDGESHIAPEKCFVTDEGLGMKIDHVSSRSYNGVVYNFEVEEDRSYVTDRVVVHNCITAMEAQAAGLRIVTSPIAALNETVGPRGEMISGDWLDDAYKQQWSSKVVEAMNSTDEDGVRQRNTEYAVSNFGMDELSEDWDKLIQDTVEEVKDNVVVPYKSVT